MFRYTFWYNIIYQRDIFLIITLKFTKKMWYLFNYNFKMKPFLSSSINQLMLYHSIGTLKPTFIISKRIKILGFFKTSLEKQNCQNWTKQNNSKQNISPLSAYLEQFIVLYVSVPIWQTQLTSEPLYKHSCGADHLETSYFGAIGEFLPSDTVASVAFNQPLLLCFV